MKNKRNIILMWIFALIPVLLVAILYPHLPDIVPTNFGFDGTVNTYGPKSTLWMLGGMCPLLALLFQFLPFIDPRKRNYAKFQKYYDIFCIGTELFLLVIVGLLLTEIVRPGTVSIVRSITALISILFIFLGNMMGKIKPNFFFGIRTPWTIADPDIWGRTHTLGGKLWFFTGLVLLPASLLLPEKIFFIIMMVGILGSSLLVCILSYLWFKQKNDM